jgi:hypothetical protein
MAGDLPEWYDLYLQNRRRKPSQGAQGKAGAGGGKPKVRIGRTGPRGRKFPVISTPKQRSVVIKSKYVKATETSHNDLRRWLVYCTKEKLKETIEKDLKTGEKDPTQEKLPLEHLREQTFFNEHSDGMNFFSAFKLIRENPGKNVAFHTLILSSGHRQIEPKDYARSQMAALEAELGHKLTWVANIHRDTGADKMHINVTIAGRIPETEEIDKVREDRLEPLTVPTGFKIDVDEVRSADKITGADGRTYTKFDSVETLKSFDRYCQEDFENHIPRDDYAKLWQWIGTKEQHGEGAYGKPPLKPVEYELDLAQVPEAERIVFNSVTFTKFNSLKQLAALEKVLAGDASNQLTESQQEKLRYWIETKERRGEDVFGQAPLKEIEPVETEQKEQADFYRSPAIDTSKVPSEEQVNLLGKIYTKHHPVKELSRLHIYLESHPEAELPNAKRDLLDSWIHQKLVHGDDVFGEAPIKQNYLHSYHRTDGDAIPLHDKLTLHGKTYTKYDSLGKLEDLYERISQSDARQGSRHSKTDQHLAKLDRWILNKLTYGDGFEGEPPTKEIPTEGRAKLDLDKLPDSQKVDVEGNIYTKFHSRGDLAHGIESLSAQLDKHSERLEKFADKYKNFKELDSDKQELVKAQYQHLKSEKASLEEDQTKLKFWDHLKEAHGDGIFGAPPLKQYEINYRKIPAEERIKVGTEICTKYDSIERLTESLAVAKTGGEVTEQKQEQLAAWIQTKKELGEDAFGEPPLKDAAPTRFQRDYNLVQDPTDRGAAELLNDRTISPEGARLKANFDRMDRAKELAEKQEIMRHTANQRGDVFFTTKMFEAMRHRGNAYVNYHINLDKTLEREFKHVFGERVLEIERNYERKNETEKDKDVTPDLDSAFEAALQREFDLQMEMIEHQAELEAEREEAEERSEKAEPGKEQNLTKEQRQQQQREATSAASVSHDAAQDATKTPEEIDMEHEEDSDPYGM